ncbi:hypothetical protein [Cellulomonas sp. S1-8]|uniref:hypothetical protein n=1 Tax=Cellulomonas sp. S1-8 TaxID=2904790 RepID=UPI0022430EF7|nr:hypothetical protein [Cellulomonas sp. S1-8]UZN03239.1 hypothetical protein OKX07_19670 [Cellulomonas sp. S1-8]
MHVLSSVRRPGVVRALVVGALTGALALVPGAAHAHGQHPPRVVNHAPDRPADVRTTQPDSTCTTRPPAPLRSTTPTLRAVLSDRDGDAVSGTFTVRDVRTGRQVWTSGATTTQASGSEHAVAVPEGLLRDGRGYEWRVQARDAKGRTSPTVRCRIVVDVTAPGATDVTPVDGAGAVYAEDATAGGVGVAGSFRFEVPGATDVVAFLYGFDGGQARVDVADGDTGATVTWTPDTAGSHVLDVQAVDAAGNVGPTRSYRFVVESAASAPTGNARWTLDEGTGTTSADVLSTDGGNVLTLTPSTTWTDGLTAELAGRADAALLLDEATDGAATSGTVVDTTGSWSVAAFVRADAGDLAATAVSQDGDGGSAFRLGTSTTACEDAGVTCWAFSVAGDDPDGIGSTTVTSSVPVVPGAWVALFGWRDAASGLVRLDVCSFGTVDEPGDQVPVPGALGFLDGGAPAVGAFRVGGAQDGATPWVGAVSGVRTWGGVIDVSQERRLCSMGA